MTTKSTTTHVHLETFGCQMNEYDSELVRSLMKQDGFVFTDERERAGAGSVQALSPDGTEPGRHGAQELVHLAVGVECEGEVGDRGFACAGIEREAFDLSRRQTDAQVALQDGDGGGDRAARRSCWARSR